MPIITLSSKHQVTLPAEMVRSLGLKAGAKLVAELIDDHIMLLPQPESWVDYFKGSMKGFWGTDEEIDRYIAQERSSAERNEWIERFDDLMATDRDARCAVQALNASPSRAAVFNDLERSLQARGTVKDTERVRAAVERLVGPGWVRRIPPDPDEGGATEVLRLVHEVAPRVPQEEC